MTEFREKVEKMRQEVVTSLLESIEAAPLKWEQGWINLGFEAPENAVSRKCYNGFNLLNLYVTAIKRQYEDPRWLTFKQAQDIGASVKKGESASKIFYFTQYDKKTHKPYDKQTTQGMSEADKQKYEDENVRMVLKYYSVFNAEQCDNMPKRVKPEPMSEAELKKQNQLIEDIIANSAAPIYYDGGDEAFYNGSKDEIHLPAIENFTSKAEYYATALHEIAHSTRAESRMNRPDSKNKEEYAIEELRAELACVFIQQQLGLNLEATLKNHAAYLQSWLEICKKDGNVFVEAVSSAGKIADYIVENYAKSARKQETEITQEKKESINEPAQNPKAPSGNANITNNRLKELSDLFDNETEEAGLQKWRQSLTPIEKQLVEVWDKNYSEGEKLLDEIKSASAAAFAKSKDVLKSAVQRTAQQGMLKQNQDNTKRKSEGAAK